MKVKELQKFLEDLNPELEVYVETYGNDVPVENIKTYYNELNNKTYIVLTRNLRGI